MKLLQLLVKCFTGEASYLIYSSLILVTTLKFIADINARHAATKMIKSNNCMIINAHFVNKKCSSSLQPSESSMVIEQAYYDVYSAYSCIFTVCVNSFNQQETIVGDYCCHNNLQQEMNWIQNLCDIRPTIVGNSSKIIAIQFYHNFYTTIYHKNSFAKVSSSKTVKRCCSTKQSQDKLFLCMIEGKKNIFTSLTSIQQLYASNIDENWGQSGEVTWAVI